MKRSRSVPDVGTETPTCMQLAKLRVEQMFGTLDINSSYAPPAFNQDMIPEAWQALMQRFGKEHRQMMAAQSSLKPRRPSSARRSTSGRGSCAHSERATSRTANELPAASTQVRRHPEPMLPASSNSSSNGTECLNSELDLNTQNLSAVSLQAQLLDSDCSRDNHVSSVHVSENGTGGVPKPRSLSAYRPTKASMARANSIQEKLKGKAATRSKPWNQSRSSESAGSHCTDNSKSLQHAASMRHRAKSANYPLAYPSQVARTRGSDKYQPSMGETGSSALLRKISSSSDRDFQQDTVKATLPGQLHPVVKAPREPESHSLKAEVPILDSSEY